MENISILEGCITGHTDLNSTQGSILACGGHFNSLFCHNNLRMAENTGCVNLPSLLNLFPLRT